MDKGFENMAFNLLGLNKLGKDEPPADKVEAVGRIGYSHICSCGRKATVYHTDVEAKEIISLLEPDWEKVRGKIDNCLRREMVTIGSCVEDARTGQIWAYDSERLSKRIIKIIKGE